MILLNDESGCLAFVSFRHDATICRFSGYILLTTEQAYLTPRLRGLMTRLCLIRSRRCCGIGRSGGRILRLVTVSESTIPCPVPFIPRDGTGRDRDGIFKMGRDCAYAAYPAYNFSF